MSPIASAGRSEIGVIGSILLVQRAFVIGNAAWDETLHLDALPSPGASIHVRRGQVGPGGKGLNQAVVLARAGVPTVLVAVIGRDAAGDAIAAALADEGLAGGLIRRAEVATDWSGILVAAAGENAVLTTRDAARSLGPAAVEAALSSAAPGDLCVLQGNLSGEATAAAVAEAKRRDMTVAFNPSPVDPGFAGLLGEADVLFLNREEALAFAGGTELDAVRALGAGQAVVTLGGAGAMLVTEDGAELVPAVPAELRDPTGAGDVFLATALAAAGRGWRLDRAALEAGAAAAALAVSREGAFAALPSRDELARIIGSR